MAALTSSPGKRVWPGIPTADRRKDCRVDTVGAGCASNSLSQYKGWYAVLRTKKKPGDFSPGRIKLKLSCFFLLRSEAEPRPRRRIDRQRRNATVLHVHETSVMTDLPVPE